MNRDNLLTALYQTSSKGELLKQFETKLSNAKGTKPQRYTFLLEQIVFYSHAIIFGHSIQTANNYKGYFRNVAKGVKQLKLSENDINKAFSFLNSTKKETIKKAIEPKTTVVATSKDKVIDDGCIAIDEIKRLKSDLDNKSYKLSKGQKIEDQETFIKIALVALSVGARLKDIMEDLTISNKKGTIIFDDGIKKEKGIILELDSKTAQTYLRAIRSHYKDRIGKVDISTGIRKAIKRLNIQNAKNLNHLNIFYKECITSSTQK